MDQIWEILGLSELDYRYIFEEYPNYDPQINVNDYVEGFKRVNCERGEFEKMIDCYKNYSSAATDTFFLDYVDGWCKNNGRFGKFKEILDSPDVDLL